MAYHRPFVALYSARTLNAEGREVETADLLLELAKEVYSGNSVMSTGKGN